jgi:hypothetical protein
MIPDPTLVDLDHLTHPPSSPIARSFFPEEAESAQSAKDFVRFLTQQARRSAMSEGYIHVVEGRSLD